MEEMTPYQLFEIAQKDLSRLGKKHNIDVYPKASTFLVVWQRDIRLCDYTSFKNDYLYSEDCLKCWLDDQRRLRGVDFSMRWLRAYRQREFDNKLLQWIVSEAV